MKATNTRVHVPTQQQLVNKNKFFNNITSAGVGGSSSLPMNKTIFTSLTISKAAKALKPPLALHLRRSALTTMSSNTNNESYTLDEIFQQKRQLRSKVRKGLKDMDPSQRTHEDDAIQSIVLEAPWFRSCKGLCAYISCSALREVDTSKLLSEILHNPGQDVQNQIKRKVYVPRVEDKNSNMRMLNISTISDLIANSMNILEPAPLDADGNEREDVLQADAPVDLLLLPGLAFDRSGRRLGRGGGYYDTFLKKYQELAKEKNWRQPLLVALSYSVQIVDGVIPVTPTDVPVDALVTPTGVIPISPTASERMNH